MELLRSRGGARRSPPAPGGTVRQGQRSHSGHRTGDSQPPSPKTPPWDPPGRLRAPRDWDPSPQRPVHRIPQFRILLRSPGFPSSRNPPTSPLLAGSAFLEHIGKTPGSPEPGRDPLAAARCSALPSLQEHRQPQRPMAPVSPSPRSTPVRWSRYRPAPAAAHPVLDFGGEAVGRALVELGAAHGGEQSRYRSGEWATGPVPERARAGRGRGRARPPRVDWTGRNVQIRAGAAGSSGGSRTRTLGPGEHREAPGVGGARGAGTGTGAVTGTRTHGHRHTQTGTRVCIPARWCGHAHTHNIHTTYTQHTHYIHITHTHPPTQGRCPAHAFITHTLRHSHAPACRTHGHAHRQGTRTPSLILAPHPSPTPSRFSRPAPG